MLIGDEAALQHVEVNADSGQVGLHDGHDGVLGLSRGYAELQVDWKAQARLPEQARGLCQVGDNV